MIEIIHKNHPTLVKEMRVDELDIEKCSHKFLTHKFSGAHLLYVRCNKDGTLDLRGKRQEYRIIKISKPEE